MAYERVRVFDEVKRAIDSLEGRLIRFREMGVRISPYLEKMEEDLESMVRKLNRMESGIIARLNKVEKEQASLMGTMAFQNTKGF